MLNEVTLLTQWVEGVHTRRHVSRLNPQEASRGNQD